MAEARLKKRVAVFISGSGSNLQALLDAASAPEYPAEIFLVLSNKADAYGLERAKKAGVPTVVISHKDYPTREAFDDAMDAELAKANIEIVCLAGFMRLLSEPFVRKWQGRMLNIHPSLLPDYKGLHTHARALADGASKAGCTVHFVTPELDDGPIISQAEVPILSGDTEEVLAARVLVQEHKIYPQALARLARGEISFPLAED